MHCLLQVEADLEMLGEMSIRIAGKGQGGEVDEAKEAAELLSGGPETAALLAPCWLI